MLRLCDAWVLHKEPNGNCVLNCFLENDDPRPGGRAVEDPKVVYDLRCFFAKKLVEYRHTKVTSDDGFTFGEMVPYGATLEHRDAAGVVTYHYIDTFDDYIEYISIPGAWLTEVDILLYSRVRRMNIAVYQRRNHVHATAFEPESYDGWDLLDAASTRHFPGGVLCLEFIDRNHYNVLMLGGGTGREASEALSQTRGELQQQQHWPNLSSALQQQQQQQQQPPPPPQKQQQQQQQQQVGRPEPTPRSRPPPPAAAAGQSTGTFNRGMRRAHLQQQGSSAGEQGGTSPKNPLSAPPPPPERLSSQQQQQQQRQQEQQQQQQQQQPRGASGPLTPNHHFTSTCAMAHSKTRNKLIEERIEAAHAGWVSRAVPVDLWLESNPTFSLTHLKDFSRMKREAGKITFLYSNREISHVCFDPWGRTPLKPAGVLIGPKLETLASKRQRKAS
jgi:hypothetical protein